jgi:acetylornithine deacetylase/succinyl-diaminopimelate desuccinylase-like protein
VEGVLKTIQQVVGDKVTVTRMSEPVPSAPSALRPEVMGPIEKVTGEFWPGVPVVPAMSTGATDSRFMRNGGIPMYGVSGLFLDQDDNRSHGLNERMPVKSLYDGHEFLYRLVKELAGGK